jgi:membrane fusion protein, copper/silver efflux system
MTAAPLSQIKWLAGALALAALGVGGGYWWAHRTMMADSSGTASSSSANTANPSGAVPGKGGVLYWYDPMKPDQHFEKPGKSPFMDMQLVPKYADQGGEGGGVRVSPGVVQNLGIRFGKVEKASLKSGLRAVGSVAFDDRLLELVQSRVEGYVTRLYVKAPLERVRRGEPLATILAPQWLEAQQEYLTLVDARSDSAQPIRDAARQRLVVLGVPDATIRAVETKHETNAATTLVAPIDGVVTELGARDGAAFMAGASLFRINGLATVWVNAQIPESRVSMVPVGSTVVAHATAWPGVTFKGRVIAFLPQVDPQTRTLTVRVALDNPQFRLSPGMWVTLDFTAPPGEPQLLVPSEAVIVTGERSVVIVAGEGGSFDVVSVTTGVDQDGRTPILSGLKEGQPIVLSGQFLIDSEASLTATVNRLQAAGATGGSATTGMDMDAPASGSAAPQPARHLAQGVITALTAQQITISHGPVPSLQWPAMTMGFKAPMQGAPKDLKVGDHVSFSFSALEDGSFQIDAITPNGASGTPERQP